MKIFLLTTFILHFPVFAAAKSIEAVMALPTDSAAPHPLLSNPAIYAPKSTAITFGQSLRWNKVKLERKDATPSTVRGETDERVYSLNVSSKVASAVTLGIQADYAKLSDASNLDTSGWYARNPAAEDMKKQSLQGRFAVDLVQNLRLGVSFRHSNVSSSIIGSFGIAPDEKISFKGSMNTLAAGAWLNSNQLAFAAMYMLPERGKVKLQGEDRVITEPGLIAANMHYELSKEFRFGFGFNKWMYEKDEMSETVEIQENRWISLNGLNPDRDIYILQSVAFGFDYVVRSLVQLRAAVNVEQWEYTETQANLKSSPQKSNQFQTIRPRLALTLLHKDATLSFGGEYGVRKLDKSSEDRNPFKITTEDKSLYGSISLNF